MPEITNIMKAHCKKNPVKYTAVYSYLIRLITVNRYYSCYPLNNCRTVIYTARYIRRPFRGVRHLCGKCHNLPLVILVIPLIVFLLSSLIDPFLHASMRLSQFLNNGLRNAVSPYNGSKVKPLMQPTAIFII